MTTETKRRSILMLIAERIDQRIIYLFVGLALAIPLINDIALKPAQMSAADAFFKEVDNLKSSEGKLVLIAMDWGPGTGAENKPQTMVAMEHLFRKRIPFAVISLYSLASDTMKQVPLEVAKNLEKEFPGEKWEYGKDWVNLGYQQNGSIAIQALAQAEDWHKLLKSDAFGVPLSEIPLMKNVHTIRDVQMLMEFTGLVGVFGYWVQFFNTDQYRPPMVHGCTSITIPEAYIYYASRQIVGFFEGVAGAAWYETRLKQNFPTRRVELATKVNTALAFAQIAILVFILLGNINFLLSKREKITT